MASSTSSSSFTKSATFSSSPSSSLNIPDTGSAEPLYQVKLLSALRNGDPTLIHPFLAEIGKEKRKSAGPATGTLGPSTSGNNNNVNGRTSENNDLDTGAAALHLAIRCASLDTVTLLLSHRAISPNGVHPPGSGTTPLHLAAALGRADVVNLLLEQDAIDDTLLDSGGHTARECARGREVGRVFDDSVAFLNAEYRSLLRSYILSPFPSHGHSNSAASAANSPLMTSAGSSPQLAPSQVGQPPPALLALLSSPRARHLDLSYLDDASGRALLHEAARRRDLRLLELAVRAGADVYVRDRRGRLPGQNGGGADGGGGGGVISKGGGKGGKGEGEVKAFLRQLTNQDAALLNPAPPTAAPVLRGYLNKYTNVAKGWNTRWFVLKDGVMSYYRNQEDEAFASRGSIAVKNCVLKPPTHPAGTRFEIHSGAAGRGGEKWYVKASHPGEAGRWVTAISASVAWVKAREGDLGNESDGRASTTAGGNASGAASIISASGSVGGSVSAAGGGRQRLVSVLRKSTAGSVTSVAGSLRSNEVDSELGATGGNGNGGSGEVSPRPGESDADADEEDEDDDDGVEDSSASASIRTGRVAAPHEANFELLGNSATAQLELVLGLIGPGGAQDALRDGLQLVSEYVGVARERDAWWRRKLSRARTKQSAWERSLASAVREGEALERELRFRSRKRGSRFFRRWRGPDACGTRVLAAATVIEGREEEMEESAVLVSSPALQEEAEPTPTRANSISTAPVPIAVSPPAPPVRSATADTLVPSTATSLTFGGRPYSNYGDAESMIDTDEEDEFFDAIEANNIPNLVVHDALKSPTHSELALPHVVNVEPYAGYQHLRERLLLTNERPSTSLWSVLKHSIGKDLTKISFPVFFNEPTSMLQRMAEDMEFSECLDVAAKERDAHRRLAFVAAFAMSNYSSTIGRIAKPFNPMLSETFEYVRIDKEYRYLSEQVSHHPPISACMAESPYWKYFGEVDAQNKFMGKSFEIRPTGVAHAELLLPVEFAPSYPKAPSPFDGKVREHYSWKKVTTNVSGFILGSPTIDHYGDMVVRSQPQPFRVFLAYHALGRSRITARKIHACSPSSREAGVARMRMRSQDVLWTPTGACRTRSPVDGIRSSLRDKSGAGSGALNPDLSVSSLNSPSATPEYILLWRNSEKPEGSPFNLTPFAITLNDCPSTLKPYLCPTDCRLRPDQRAFEMGKYEIANGLKNEQEEKQRATRKLREQGELPPHKPRWFTAETDGDTGERVWAPSRLDDGSMEYWAERERVWKMGGNKPWTDVAPIFIDEPDFMR
ncbi:Oxysterol-binding protein [Mycena sanguinolenta]|uniref:Oxysterol-binding protein n=1 Tax=Mycena sanguinolenta TaxID=230812 RepID=A0A8H6ZJM7_9AGAR|nr:Oxysterol-binding protein [Mycena sanguinolenta]